MDLQQLRENSPLLIAATPEGLAESRSQSESCVVLPLPDSIGDLTHVLPWNILQNANYYRHRAMRHGDYRIEAVDQRDLEEAYEALLHLHSVRWSERDEPGVLADPKVQAAHRETIPALLQDDCLRMYVIRLADRIAAVFYGLADPPGRPTRTVYYYLGGFDPQYKELSPGTLLIAHALEQAVEQGFRTFDFLRGGESYKYRWGAKDRITWRRQLHPINAPVSQQQEVLR
jgi:CelD/BcsL family acetyltransferase involved in cellulose biosynthesis